MRYTGTGPITLGHIPDEDRPAVDDAENDSLIREAMRNCIHKYVAMGKGLKHIGRIAEDLAIDLTMTQCNGSTPQAAKILQVSDRTLQLRKADSGKSASRSA